MASVNFVDLTIDQWNALGQKDNGTLYFVSTRDNQYILYKGNKAVADYVSILNKAQSQAIARDSIILEQAQTYTNNTASSVLANANNIIDAKVDTLKRDTANKLSAKADKISTYSKTEVDAKINATNNAIATKATSSTVYTRSEVDAKFRALVDDAPPSLDTLRELAQHLQQNQSYASALATQISTKAEKTSVYLKSEVDAKIRELTSNLSSVLNTEFFKVNENIKTKAEKTSVYLRGEIDAKISAVNNAIATKANANNTYTPKQVEDRIRTHISDLTPLYIAKSKGLETLQWASNNYVRVNVLGTQRFIQTYTSDAQTSSSSSNNGLSVSGVGNPDCNTYKTPGIYQGSFATNRPVGSNSYGTLLVTQTTNNSTSYVRQLYMDEDSRGRIWTRYNTNPWKQLITATLSGTTLNITL